MLMFLTFSANILIKYLEKPQTTVFYKFPKRTIAQTICISHVLEPTKISISSLECQVFGRKSTVLQEFYVLGHFESTFYLIFLKNPRCLSFVSFQMYKSAEKLNFWVVLRLVNLGMYSCVDKHEGVFIDWVQLCCMNYMYCFNWEVCINLG